MILFTVVFAIVTLALLNRYSRKIRECELSIENIRGELIDLEGEVASVTQELERIKESVLQMDRRLKQTEYV